MRIFYFITLFFLFTTSANAKLLTINEAISLSLGNDPLLAKISSQAKALGEKSVAVGQLPDPKATLGVQSLPLDSLDRSRESMTQLIVGFSQSFPRGKTLSYKEKKTKAEMQGILAKYKNTKLEIAKKVSLLWFDLYYWNQAKLTINHSEKLLKKVIKATESNYGTGRQNAGDVISSELELSVLEDKKIDIDRRIENLQADLSKWIGTVAASRKLPKNMPKISAIKSYESIKASLANHPKINITDSMVEAEKYGVNLAEQQYKPGFNLGVNYGLRGGKFSNGNSRPDMVTAKLSFDMPLFTAKRQDKSLSSSRYKLKSAEYKRDDALRDLNSMLDKEYSNWNLFGKRAKHYGNIVTKQASENFEAALRSYQEDRYDFSSLIRAQVMELNTKLEAIKLKVAQAKAEAGLIYLQGETL